MNVHERTKEQLVSLALGELSERQEVDIRSHVSECEPCRRELERVEKLLACAGQLNELSVDEQMCESAGRDVLLAVKHQTTQNSREGHRPRTALIWRVTMRSPMAKLAVAAAVVVAVIIAFHGLGGSTPAFADIVRPILAARTAVFTVITQIEDQPAVTLEGKFMEPGLGRHTMKLADDPAAGNVTIVDYVRGRGIVLVPAQKTAMVIEFTNASDEFAPAKMNTFKVLRDQIIQAQENPDESVECLGRSQVSGREAIGYRMKHQGMDCTIWADVESLLPLQVEYAATETIGRPTTVTMMDIRFDVPLDPAEFSTDVPDGYTAVTMEADVSEPTEVDLIETLALWAETTGKFPAELTLEGTKELFEALDDKGVTPDKEKGFADPAFQDWMKTFQKVNRSLTFVRNLPEEADRHYAGADVTFGDKTQPVFWYRPEGSATYRVIFADLHTDTVTAEQLAQLEAALPE